jgi:hypothetical protein
MGKPKKVLFELIKPEEVFLSGQPYELLAEIRAENHFDTAEASIALAWKKGTKPDVDGRLVLGRCVKASDLQRELVDYDFVIVLNKEVWEDPDFNRERKLALLDHEMCHAARAVDDDGEKKTDSKGRPVWRTRGHDIEEFTEIVNRRGCWKRDLEKFAEALLAKKKTPLFAGTEAPDDASVERLMNIALKSFDAARDPEKLAALHRAADDKPEFAGILAAMDKVASSVRTDGIDSLTISTPGMDPVVIDKVAAENIHKAAKQKKKT